MADSPTAPISIGGDATENILVTGSNNVIIRAEQLTLRAAAQARAEQHDPARMLRILTLMAAPVFDPRNPDTPPIPLDLRQEWHKLSEKVRSSHAPILLMRLVPPTLDALRAALSPGAEARGERPHILHFSGHAWAGGLLLEDEFGQAAPASTEAIIDALKGAQDASRPLDLAVLNGCESSADLHSVTQALVDAGIVRAAVGHPRRVRDEEAIAFATRLYADLTQGIPLREAVRRAQEKITTHEVLLLGEAELRFEVGEKREPVIHEALPHERLPSPAPRFTGRGKRLVELARHLAAPPAVAVITGPPAIGKTSLMVEAARRQAWRFPGGIAWAEAPRAEAVGVEEEQPSRFDTLLNRLAEELGLKPQDGVEEAILAHTRLRPTLLLLDNLESLPPQEMEQLESFLRGLGEESAAILALRPPHPALEQIPAMRPIPLHEGLKEAEALRYLAWLLRRRQIPMKAAQMEAIVRAAGGHPKLLELLAVQSGRRDLRRLLTEVEAKRGDYTAQLEKVYAWVAARMEAAGEHRAWQKLQAFPADGVPEEVFWQAVGREGAEGLRRAALADFDPAAQLWRWHGSVADYARSRWPMAAEAREALETALLPAWQGWLEALPPEERAACLESTLPHLEAMVAQAARSGGAQGWAFLEALHRVLPAPDRTLSLRAVQVPLYRTMVALAPDEAARAAALNNLGAALAALGRREAALQATQEAVAIRRQLAETNPKAFLPALATSLDNLGAMLPDLGQREAALKATQEAVSLYRQLAEADPQAFLPDLAASLNNLGSDLSYLGRRDEALQATREAVSLYRQLARANPQPFLPYLATSLNNLGNILSELGRHEEALQAAQEAVSRYHQLTRTHPQAFLPALAASLNNLGSDLSNLGRHEAALHTTQEAVAIRRQLAEVHPQAFLPNLALSLNNLGRDLAALGRHEAALQAAQEAVSIYYQLAKAHPRAFLPDLAASLNNLGNHLSDLGRREAALRATQEAVAIRRQLAKAHPQAFLPALARSLGMLGTVLRSLGRHGEAADTFGEGLRAITPALHALPQAFGGLAGALLQGYLSACREAGREPDAALLQALQ